MKPELTGSQRKQKEIFRKFVDEKVILYADETDREERFSEKVLKSMIDDRYIGSMIPKRYGGLEMDMITLGVLNEELGRGCSSVRSLITVHGMVALALQRWGTQAQKEYYLPQMASGKLICAFALTEPDVGSDAKSVKTEAVSDGDSYIITGTKKWTTLGQMADVFLVFCQCEGKSTALLVHRDTLGLSVKPITGLLGSRGCMIAELTMDHCVVPKNHIVGSVGTGLSHVALTCLDYGRFTIAWGCVGAAQACLEDSVRYARKRTQFGEPLRKNQLIQKMITEMVVEIKAARMLCYSASYLMEMSDPGSIMETWAAKYFASKMVNKVANHAVQIHGANGCSRAYAVERHLRDAKIAEIIEGTSQMHEILIANSAFRGI